MRMDSARSVLPATRVLSKRPFAFNSEGRQEHKRRKKHKSRLLLCFLRLLCSLSFSQNFAHLGTRGNGKTSRIFPIPVMYIKARSKPSPNPAWGTVPYLRMSRYH